MCTVERCPRRSRLQHDHDTPWVKCHETALRNLQLLCEYHHDLKSQKGWDLVDGVGRRPMVPPDDPRHPKRVRRADSEAPAEHDAA